MQRRYDGLPALLFSSVVECAASFRYLSKRKLKPARFAVEFVRRKPAQGFVAIALPTTEEGELPAISPRDPAKDRCRLAPGCRGHAATSDSTLTYERRKTAEVFV
jgi:hypothetical protein